MADKKKTTEEGAPDDQGSTGLGGGWTEELREKQRIENAHAKKGYFANDADAWAVRQTDDKTGNPVSEGTPPSTTGPLPDDFPAQAGDDKPAAKAAAKPAAKPAAAKPAVAKPAVAQPAGPTGPTGTQFGFGATGPTGRNW